MYVLERKLINPFAKFSTNQIVTRLARNKIVSNPILTPLSPTRFTNIQQSQDQEIKVKKFASFWQRCLSLKRFLCTLKM